MKGRVGGASREDGERSRGLILEAILDLPLGATLRDVAAKVGQHVNTVQHHVLKLRKTGHVRVVTRGYNHRRVVVPMRVRLSEEEASWLKLGVTTTRAVVVVARADGERVTSREVAKELGWHLSTARYHLVRASAAGVLDGRPQAGYVLAGACPADLELAGLPAKSYEAVHYISEQARRVTSEEVAKALNISRPNAKWYLKRAVKANLLTVRLGVGGGFAVSAGASRINWKRSSISSA